MNFTYLTRNINIAWDLLQELGPRCFIRDIFPWTFYRRYLFYSQDIHDQIPSPSCQVPFRLELIKEKDLPLLLKVRPGFYHISYLQERLKKGHLCFLGWTGRKPVHIRWIFVHSCYLPYLYRTIILSPREVYVDEAYTRPEYRRQGVYSYAGYLMRLTLKDLGYQRFICVFASWNSSSQNSSRKIGVKKVGEGKCWNILGIKKFFWEGMVQDYGNGKISIKREE